MSPDPVASKLPVGEKEAQRIGDEWPVTELECVFFQKRLHVSPDSVEEHLVAGRTRNTLCGEQ